MNTEELERKVREVVDLETQGMDELTACKMASDALGSAADGYDMRASELEDESTD